MPYLCLNLFFFYFITVLDLIPSGYGKIVSWIKYGFYNFENAGGEFCLMATILFVIAVVGRKLARDIDIIRDQNEEEIEKKKKQ